MNKGLDMLVTALFLQALPKARLKFSGYLGTTQQLMNEAYSYVLTLRQEKQHKLPVSVATHKQDPAVSEHGNPYEVGALCFKLFLASRSQVLIENCALLLNLAKRIPTVRNTGPELSISTVTNVRAIHAGVMDRITDIARQGDRTTYTNKVKSGRNGHDTIVIRMVVSTCVVTSVNGPGMLPGSVLAAPRNLIRRATNGTHRSGSNVVKTSSDSSDNCRHKLSTNSKGHRVTFQIRVRHPFLQRRPRVHGAKGLVI